MSPQDDNAIIAVIAQAVARGQCILFLGAGVHFSPPDGSSYTYPEDKRPPTGGSLSEGLAEKCGFLERFPQASPRDLPRVSLYYEVRFSRQQLMREIRGAVHDGKEPSPVLRALAHLNFPLVITTNYDQLFEQALRDVGKAPIVSIYQPEENVPTVDYQDGDPDEQHPFVLKLHGDVLQTASIVITDEDYIQFVLRMSDKEPFHPIPLTAKYRFTKWPTLFVGYSLIDYNLRLLFKTLRWKLDPANFPLTYSIDPYPDPLILDVWYNRRRYVQFVTQDVWTFVPTLYQMIKRTEMPA